MFKRLKIPSIGTVFVALVVLASPPIYAADLLSVSVEKKGKRYYVNSVSTYAASREALMHILTDYDNFDRVSSVFTESYFLPEGDSGDKRAYTRVEGCVWFFCKSIERVDVLLIEQSRVVALSDPALSDFKYSKGQWDFETTDAGQTITYALEMEPGFWVPPVIGPYILKRRLVDGAVEAVQRVEALAQERDRER